jgi:hypothetical protein
MIDKLIYRGKTYMPLTITQDWLNAELKGTYFEIGLALVSGNGPIEETSNPPTRINGLVVGYGPNTNFVTPDVTTDDSDPNVPPSSYYNIYENVSTDFITIDTLYIPDPSLYTVLSIIRALTIWVGSTKHRYTSGPLSPSQFGIDYANGRITFRRPLRDATVEYDFNATRLVKL